MKKLKEMNFIIVDKEEVSRALLVSYLKEVGCSNIAQFSDFSVFKNSLDEDSFADETIVVLDVSDETKSCLEQVNKISAENSNCKFVIISYNISANFIVDVLKSGAKEFLGKPIIKEDFIQVVKKVTAQFNAKHSNEKHGRVISTFSNKGGLGKTTVAVNLAKELSDVTKEKVVLLDLNLHLGDVTAFLDINPTYDISYIIENIEKADEEFLLASLEQYKTSDLYILADSPFRETDLELDPSDLKKLIKVLKKSFSYVIIDNNSTVDSRFNAICEESDAILLVTTANLPTLRNCKRCLELFDKMGFCNDKLKIVLNRFASNEGYTLEDVETVLNKPVFWNIPNNYFAAIEAINKGITLREVNSSSNITENYTKLAHQIVNQV